MHTNIILAMQLFDKEYAIIGTMNQTSNFFVISDYPNSDDTLRYASAIKAIGFEPIRITHADFEKVQPGDAVILRGSPKRLEQVLQTLRHIETVGAVCLTSTKGWAASKDRYKTYLALKENEVTTPYTASSASVYLKNNSVPAVIKLSDSNGGRGVSIADSVRSLTTFTGTLENLGASFVIQEYIELKVAEDFRYFVVGDTVVAAMKRTAVGGDFRSNLSLGSSAVAVAIDPEMALIAIKAAQSVQLSLAGVDIIVSENGPIVIEVNSSPGLGIEDITGIDVAGAVVKEVRKVWEK